MASEIPSLSITPLGPQDLPAALARLRGCAEAGDVVLLAPATSSYDQYKNYEERGDHFCRLVKELV